MNKDERFPRRAHRRRFLLDAGAVLGTFALTLPFAGRAQASDLPHLSPADKAAKALHYTEDASKIDRASTPSYVPGSRCANCGFFQGSGPFGPCVLFPGRAVSENGWCSGYQEVMEPG